MGNLGDLARHWSRQSEKGKGIRIEADALDVLNAIGVGELIQTKAAEEQRAACNQRLTNSTREGNTGSRTTENETDLSDPPSSKSSGTIGTQDVTAAARRAQRASGRRKPN